MAVCLVTGGGGFIGSHLVDALVARGDHVRILDNFCTGRRANLAGVEDRIEIINGDLRCVSDVRRAVAGVELVFHQAALASVPRSLADPLATHEACVTGTLNLLQAARDAKVRRLVYAGSSSAYGNTTGQPNREDDLPRPLSPYAAAKLAGEQYCTAFTQSFGLETVRLRYFNIFGPRQPPGSPYSAVIPLFIEAIAAGRSPTVHGDGRQTRDFTYVANAVQANLLAADMPGIAGRLYNVACGRSTSLLDLVSTLNCVMGTDVGPVHTAPRPGDVRHSLADISRAQAELGYRPSVSLLEGLRHCVAHARSLTAQAGACCVA